MKIDGNMKSELVTVIWTDSKTGMWYAVKMRRGDILTHAAAEARRGNDMFFQVVD